MRYETMGRVSNLRCDGIHPNPNPTSVIKKKKTIATGCTFVSILSHNYPVELKGHDEDTCKRKGMINKDNQTSNMESLRFYHFLDNATT